MSLDKNQTKYKYVKVLNFTNEQWNYDCTIMIKNVLVHYERLSVVALRFVGTLKNKI